MINENIIIELLTSSQSCVKSYNRAYSFFKGTIPNGILVRLIDSYDVIISNDWYNWKINYPNLPTLQEYYNQKEKIQSIRVRAGFEEKCETANDSIVMAIPPITEIVPILECIKNIVNDIADNEEIKRAVLKNRLTNMYVSEGSGLNVYPNTYSEYKKVVIERRKAVVKRGENLNPINEVSLRERFYYLYDLNEIQKKYDIYCREGTKVIKKDFITTLKVKCEHFLSKNAYFDWKVNYLTGNLKKQCPTFEKYREFIEKKNEMLYDDFYEPDHDYINEELSREGLKAFYEGFNETWLGID